MKQDVPAPGSFEGIPHHTSDSAEGRRTTIKGHSVYLNLPASACQMFQRLSFISSHQPCFIFSQLFFFPFFAPHFAPMRKEGTSDFFGWREERLKPNTLSFALGKLAEIEGFGYREADRVQGPPPPPRTDENSDTAESRGWDL